MPASLWQPSTACWLEQKGGGTDLFQLGQKGPRFSLLPELALEAAPRLLLALPSAGNLLSLASIISSKAERLITDGTM